MPWHGAGSIWIFRERSRSFISASPACAGFRAWSIALKTNEITAIPEFLDHLEETTQLKGALVTIDAMYVASRLASFAPTKAKRSVKTLRKTTGWNPDYVLECSDSNERNLDSLPCSPPRPKRPPEKRSMRDEMHIFGDPVFNSRTDVPARSRARQALCAPRFPSLPGSRSAADLPLSG